MEKTVISQQYVVCVKNEGYQASLEQRKIYCLVPDDQAAELHLLRVVDESGEDYLYPDDFFMPIDLPLSVIQRLSLAV